MMRFVYGLIGFAAWALFLRYVDLGGYLPSWDAIYISLAIVTAGAMASKG